MSTKPYQKHQQLNIPTEKGMKHIWENWGEEPWQLVWYGMAPIQSSWETKELSSNLFISILTQINLGLAIDTVVSF